MGLRETLNENPRITTGVTVVLIVIVLAWLLWPRGGDGGASAVAAGGAAQIFYTADDGQTWFPDDASKIPPFKKDGKDAVRAEVYKCGGKTFVNHLVRYTPEGQKQLAAAAAAAKSKSGGMSLNPVGETEMEVKSPGDKAWVKISDKKAQEIMKPKCSGDGSDLEVVKP